MSKRTKALKRRGVGTVQEVHTHNRAPQFYPWQQAGFVAVEKGMKAGEVYFFAGASKGQGKTILGERHGR